MANRIESFLNYVLDTETTSEIVFIETILKNEELFQLNYFKEWELMVYRQLPQIHRHAIVYSLKNDDDDSQSIGENSADDESSSSSDEEEPPVPTEEDAKVIPIDHISSVTKNTYTYIDIVRRCQRLLRLLFHGQQYHSHFTDLYFHVLEQSLKSDNEKIVAVVFQQIAAHLFETTKDNKEQKRLVHFLPTDSANHQIVLDTIHAYLAISKTDEDPTTTLLGNHLDILYPIAARFLDVRREFRDCTQYFIDGDSLLLSIAHRNNVQLTFAHGHTLHVIYMIERILVTLFNQAHQCNYTLVFFDCHHQLYRKEASILSLVRTCLIAHLSHNADKYGRTKVRQFASWLDQDYLKFAREEKPMFLFYHDMSSFDVERNHLLSENALQRLVIIYRLCGNYHQYVLQCHLYLMNRLFLTETTVQCFQVQFHRMCPLKLLGKFVKTTDPIDLHTNGQDESRFELVCQETSANDVRVLLYLTTIADLLVNETPRHLVELLAPLLVLHVALLVRLSLIDRHLSSTIPSVTFSPALSQLLVRFQQHLAFKLSSCTSTLSWSKISDLFDGRLFIFTLEHIHRSNANIRLDATTTGIVQRCLTSLNLVPGERVFHDVLNQLSQSNEISSLTVLSEQPPVKVRQRQKIIRFSNPLIDTYLKPIFSSNRQSSTFDLINPSDSQLASYKGKHYWREYKEVTDEITRIKDSSEQPKKAVNHRFRTKNQQKLYDYFTLYGKSLTTRDVRDSQLQITLPTASSTVVVNEPLANDRSDSAASGGGKKKGQHHKNQPNKVQPTKAQKIIEQNEKKKLGERIDEETNRLHNVELRMKQIPADQYASGIDLIDESLLNFTTTAIRLELLQRKLDLQRRYLRALRKKPILTSEERAKLELLEIGYFATLTEITHLENVVDPFKLKSKFMEELVDHQPLDSQDWYRFQIEKINSRLPRRERGIADSRIADFIPDPWQVQFLDSVDQRYSIIIVAPTASGKTYASYYAMQKILKDNTNSVCVYVAPTKALINQVAGTIHSKFGPVFGIFTREYRMNLQTCRILVTIPECLEMLLLSPTYQKWCQRIQYCIFDEIHCMSGDIGSDVWERIMLLINCPMIGLSATVNNGQQVRQWIENVEQQRADLFKSGKARQVTFISHHERLADLNKYLYSNRQLHPLHPVALMNAKQLTSRGLPRDFSLSPFETFRLHQAMQNKGAATNDQTPNLSPHFSPSWVIERGVCNQYSSLVCQQFNELIEQQENATIDSISVSLNPTTANQIDYPELKPMSSLIGEFVLTLKEKNLLPCIVFTDSRPLCEELAESVSQYFEQLEAELRQTKYKNQIETIEKRLLQIEKAQKKTKAKKIVKTATRKGEDGEEPDDKPAELQQMDEEDQSQLRLSGYEQDLLNGILEEGTLANRRGCDRELVDRLIERASTVNPRLVRYLKRGVAYHHPQLNNKGRLSVEGLFRNRYVQIVFSTWTLALGVHMPTKTVAFVKDSIYLDALQYRQSAGRAGRRGFDVQGNIVFLDIPMSKIRHLTISAIPNIQTHFPTSVTFLMRLLYLYFNAEDKKDAINRSLVTLQCPFAGQSPLKHQLIDIQTRYHCLHTLDFLFRLNLIGEQGDLVGLAGFCTHLHQFEPANILLAYLIDTRLFHELTDVEEMINLLAFLFTNRPWLATHKQSNRSSSVRPKTLFNSKLSLRPMSTEIDRRIQLYNSMVKEIYGFYIENVIGHMRSINVNQEQVLPFSDVSFVQPSDYDDGTLEYEMHHHHSQQTQNLSISPFAAPSGLTHQQFMSNFNPAMHSWDLAYDLDLSSRIIPLIDVEARDHTNSGYYLNSYILDFFRHGSEALLMSENELDRGETYQLLLDFLHSLTSIKVSLETILSNEIKQTDRNDASFFRPLEKKFSELQDTFSSKFYKQFK